MPESEVAQLKERIESEIQAIRARLTGYASVSQHHIIRHTYDQPRNEQQQIEHHIGRNAAFEVVIDALNHLGHGSGSKSSS